MTITNHILSNATQRHLPGQGAMNIRRCLVIHFTAGATGESSISAMKERGVSAHVVIERDGKIWQCVPFNTKAAHAGVSRWRDPRNGNKLYSGANSFSIGIEIANAGNATGALSWARKQPGFKSIKAAHSLGGSFKEEWEEFYPDQLKAVFDLSKLLVATYNLDDITGHDNIAPERKRDPGPAFPMEGLRKHCGFAGLPVTHHP